MSDTGKQKQKANKKNGPCLQRSLFTILKLYILFLFKYKWYHCPYNGSGKNESIKATRTGSASSSFPETMPEA